MAVIGFLTYEEFLAELDQDHQIKPIRVQAYNRTRNSERQPLKEYTFLVEAAVENLDADILLCRFLTGVMQLMLTLNPATDKWEPLAVDQAKLDRLQGRNERAAALFTQDLVHRHFGVAPGLIQLNQTVSVVTAWPNAIWQALEPRREQPKKHSERKVDDA